MAHVAPIKVRVAMTDESTNEYHRRRALEERNLAEILGEDLTAQAHRNLAAGHEAQIDGQAKPGSRRRAAQAGQSKLSHSGT